MTKQDEWIRSFPENCEKIKERAKKGCKESKRFLDEMKNVEIEKFDLPFWAEMAHMQVAILAAEDFAAEIMKWKEACARDDSDAAESALSRILNANPEELGAFSGIVEEHNGTPSVAREVIPLISGGALEQSVENETTSPVHSHAEGTLEESSSQTDIAALRKDAQVVADAFCRARRLAEALNPGCAEDFISAAEEFGHANDGDAISRLMKFADRDEFTDEELEVLRELYEKADLEHLDLDPLFEDDENEKREERVTKEKKSGKSDVQIYTYAEWKDSWHKR